MQSIIVKDGQTPLDVALQYCGELSVIFDIAEGNGTDDITKDLLPGQMLKVPNVVDSTVSGFFKLIYNTPVCALSEDDIEQAGEGGVSDKGVGFWKIGSTFKVL